MSDFVFVIVEIGCDKFQYYEMEKRVFDLKLSIVLRERLEQLNPPQWIVFHQELKKFKLKFKF